MYFVHRTFVNVVFDVLIIEEIWTIFYSSFSKMNSIALVLMGRMMVYV